MNAKTFYGNKANFYEVITLQDAPVIADTCNSAVMSLYYLQTAVTKMFPALKKILMIRG